MHQILPNKITSAVLLLHGLGADGADLLGLGEEWKAALPTTAFFAPDAPSPCDMAPFGYQWFSLREWTMEAIARGLDAAKPVVDKMIDGILQQHNLKPSQLVLGGFSQGTMLSLHVGLQRKDTLGGILGYSGGLFTKPENIISKPPVMLTHGTADQVVPFAASEAAAYTLHDAGVPVEFHPIKGLAHGIDSSCLDLGRDFLQRALRG
jgi:phospholipase/carboxylesterase